MSEPHAPPPISFADAFRFWLKLGFISFGGPAGQIAIMHRELVEQRRWISDGRFLHALNYCMLLPGPEAQQLATYIGWLMHRTRGGLVAGGLFVLPSLVLLITLSWLYMRFGSLPVVAGILDGIKPAVVAIVLHAAHRIGSRTLKTPGLWVIAAASFAGFALFHVPFPLIIVGAAMVGVVLGKRLVGDGSGPAHGSGAKTPPAPAIIDDDTSTPPHARFSTRRLLATVGIGLALWAGTLGALAIATGWQGVLAPMGWFFTKAALLTFGGAYAVLPYVYDGAVAQFHWLTAVQMIDGLALGETTPGPLIMVVAFVGFVGGWTHALAASPLATGIAAACVVTFFTFLPSFVFILAGGPLIESTHGNLRLKAPLTAITAAVVGVILNLAVVLGLHVFLPGGFDGAIAWPAVVLFALAAFALLRLKLGILPLIGLAGLAGLALRLFG